MSQIKIQCKNIKCDYDMYKCEYYSEPTIEDMNLELTSDDVIIEDKSLTDFLKLIDKRLCLLEKELMISKKREKIYLLKSICAKNNIPDEVKNNILNFMFKI